MAVLGLVVILLLAVVSIFGPMISPYAYDAQDAANQYAGFSAQHIFGTDNRVMYLQDSATEAASAWRLVLEQPSSTPYSVW